MLARDLLPSDLLILVDSTHILILDNKFTLDNRAGRRGITALWSSSSAGPAEMWLQPGDHIGRTLNVERVIREGKCIYPSAEQMKAS